MSAPAIVAIFGPVPAGVDLGNRIPHSVEKIGVLVPLGFAAIALMLRITARSLSKAGIKADDWLMVVALVSNFAFLGTGIGRKKWRRSYDMPRGPSLAHSALKRNEGSLDRKPDVPRGLP